MLVLTRKIGQKIILSNGVTVALVRVEGDRARIGIEAPADVEIMREELLEVANEDRN